jgi:DNA-binding FrmR family transcriptional regulator
MTTPVGGASSYREGVYREGRAPMRRTTTTAPSAAILRHVRNRLHRIESQVRAIGGMIEERRACEDVVVQMLAVRGVLAEVLRLVLSERVSECLATLPPSDAQQAISRAQPASSFCCS